MQVPIENNARGTPAPESDNVACTSEIAREVHAPEGTPTALVDWAQAAWSDVIDITRVSIEQEIQGESALPGDYFVEFDRHYGVLFRQVGSRYLCVVTRNDGMAPEIIDVREHDQRNAVAT